MTLVRALQKIGDCRRHPEQVTAQLEQLGPLELPRDLHWRPGGYARNLVHRQSDFELLFLSWSEGAATPIHDHGGQECWFLPLVGSFDLQDFDEDLVTLGRRRDVRSLDHQPGQIHRVRALKDSISLHVYAGPIDFCRVYHRGGFTWRRLLYHHVIGYEPISSSANGVER